MRRQSALIMAAVMLAAAASGCGGGSSSDSKTIKVAYQKFGNFIGADELFKKIKPVFEQQNPGVKLKLIPINADENSYYTKLNLTTEGHDASALAGNIYGVSPKMWNSTLYWENYGASVRLSYNWQQGAKGSSTNQNNIPFAYYYGGDRGQLDLSASYTLASLPSKPQITLNVQNLVMQYSDPSR